MSELNNELFITDILNSMADCLSDDQMKKLKNTLYINLHDITLQKQIFDLSTTIENNDTKKIEYFSICKKMANCSDGTIEQYKSSIWRMRTFIGKNIVDITSMDIEYYFAKMQESNRWSDITLNNQYNNLNSFFSFLFNKEIIPKNPMSKIENIHCDEELKEPFSSMEMESIRNVCYRDTREMALIEFLYATGLRVSSVVSLKWSDLDIFNRCLKTVVKGGNEKKIYFSEKSAFYLLKMMDERMTKEHLTKEEMMLRPVFVGKRRKNGDYEALTTNGVRNILKKVGIKAEIENVHPHRFRRTYACDAIKHGMPLEDLKEHMGHKQYDTTLKYARLTDNRLEHAYRTYCE